MADHVRREGLLETLDRAHRRAPLTWVVGLPGAGKTSLVAGWVAESERPAMGYRLDADDADGAGWVDAIRDAVSDRHDPLPAWSPENQADVADFARPFFAVLAREPVTLVLDDCHRVGDDAAIFAMLAELREVAGSGLRAVIISRREPPPVLARGVLGGWLALVDDLRLTGDEVTEIARAAGKGALDEDDRHALAEADGWLAHVLALCRQPASAARLPRDQGAGAVSAASAKVGDFLAAELLASVPKDQRAPLRRLAELPEIPTGSDEEAARWISPEVGRLLATLSTQRYFVDAADGRCRLHDLLRDALLRLNASDDPPELLREVRRQLASWIATAMPEAAMHLRVAAGDTTGALALLALHGSTWFARGQHRTVDGWLRPLPEPAEVADRAALAFWRAQALLPLEPEAARPLFAAARQVAVEAGDAERAYRAWCGEVESFVIQWGAVHGLADLVDDLEALPARVGPPSEELSFRTSASALTALMYGRAEDRRIARFAAATSRAVTHAPDPAARVSAAAQLLLYKMWWAGDFPGARALYQTFDAEVSAGEQLDPLPRLLWWSCASIMDWQCGDPAECYRKVDRGLALAAASGVHVRDFFLLTQGIFCALNEEDWPRAEAHLEQLARTERTHKRLDVMVHHFFRSWYSLSRGDARTALAHAERAWPVAEAIGSMFHKVVVLSALGPARVHTGDLAGAEEAYRLQIELAKAAQNPTFSFIGFCTGAEIALARRDEAAIAKQVERMLTVKALGDFHSSCGWRTPMMQELLAFAVERGILADVARQWIRQKKIPAPAAPPAGWPMPVRIEGAGGLVVHLDSGGDESAAPGGKSAKKLRTLVAVLAAKKSGATHAQLCDWLWPEAEGDRAAASLKVAIHRARQWLGYDAIRVYDGLVSLNQAVVTCDLWVPRTQRVVPLDPERVLHGFDAPPIHALRTQLRAR